MTEKAPMSNKNEIRLCGFGGQGIILAGHIIGEAATVNEHLHGVFTQDYGPEARGGSCRADVKVDDKPVPYPYVDKPSILVAMSQEAYKKYIDNVKENTIVIVDEDLVTPDADKPEPIKMPARRIALELGKIAVANVVMLGFLTAATGFISKDSMKKATLGAVPKKMLELNEKAFETGYELGLKAK